MYTLVARRRAASAAHHHARLASNKVGNAHVRASLDGMTTMQMNKLGRTGLFVSELCLGTMTFGGSGGHLGQDRRPRARRRPTRLVGRAIDAGINFIDTADVYSRRPVGADHRPGAAQPQGRRARASSSPPRSTARPAPAPTRAARRALHIMDGVKASLKRLQLDHIDLYQIHGFDPATPIEETRARARQPRAARPRALRRRVELGGVADREGAGHLRARWPRAVRVAAGLLHAGRPRPRARDRADAAQREASA